MTFVGILRELSEQSYSFCNLPPHFMWILSGRKHEAESDDELQDDDLCHELFQDYLSGVPKLELYTSMYLCYLKIEDGGLLRYRWCGQYWSKKNLYNSFIFLNPQPSTYTLLLLPRFHEAESAVRTSKIARMICRVRWKRFPVVVFVNVPGLAMHISI